jgi:hypothetical protein
MAALVGSDMRKLITRQSARIAALASLIAMSSAVAAHIAIDTPLSEVRTIGELIAKHDGDIHIVLIHGMRTSDRTTWDGFRRKLCSHLDGQCADSRPPNRLTDQLILADRAPVADYMAKPIWGDDSPDQSPRHTGSEKWLGSQPFVDHYRFPLKSGHSLMVDEINYWPLLYAFKCQFIVTEEVKLSGPNSTNIDFCAASGEMHFPWVNPSQVQALKSSRPIGGGAPLANGWIKNLILDWGISDAVLTLGTLKDYLRETVRCSFADVAALTPGDFGPQGGPSASRRFACNGETLGAGPAPPSDTRFVLMSHSLGAFVLMDTFAAAAGDANYYQTDSNCRVETAAPANQAEKQRPRPSLEVAERIRRSRSLCFILRNSNDLYFFANQFPLLELARAQGLSTEEPAHKSALTLWAETISDPKMPKQIVAFSDPGDILTFNVPKIACDIPDIACVRVVNAYPHNSFRWLGLFEDPIGAHVNYMTRDDILNIVFGQ